MNVTLISIILFYFSNTLTAGEMPAQTKCYFSPNGGCTAAIVKEITAARRIILVEAYNFTSKPIVKALVDAKRRGIDVRVIVDRSVRTERNSGINDLCEAGILTFIDSKHAIAHNKVMIIDGRTVITGSFNFTENAEFRNAENIVVLPDPTVAKFYVEEWKLHEKHSIPFTPEIMGDENMTEK